MPIGGIIAGVGALAGGILGANAAGHAADQTAAASRRAQDVQLQMYNQTREDLAPQREAQRYALDALLSMTGLPAIGSMASNSTGTLPKTAATQDAHNPGNWDYRRPGGRASGYGLFSRLDGEGTGFSDLGSIYGTYGNLPSLADLLASHPPENRATGGPITAGQNYHLSELGHPEGVYDSQGTLQQITTSPQTITAQTDGYVAPLSQPAYAGLSNWLSGNTAQPSSTASGNATASTTQPINYPANVGNPIPGSSVLENPGGQPGRYNFMMDPGYGFRFDEGLRALARSASAKGLALSGGALKAIERYGQDYASGEYGNVYNRLAGIAGIAQTGQNLTAQAGMNSANAQGQYLSSIGQANAAGTLGRASSYGDTLEQLARLYGQGAFSGSSSSNEAFIDPSAFYVSGSGGMATTSDPSP